MIDIDDDDDDANQHGDSSNSQRRSKKKDSLPGTQFKKYSLLSTLKPLPGCKSHESVHYKSTHKCSRESFDDLDTYGVDDMHVRWSILAKIGTTKIEPSHKRMLLPSPRRSIVFSSPCTTMSVSQHLVESMCRIHTNSLPIVLWALNTFLARFQTPYTTSILLWILLCSKTSVTSSS